MSLSGIGSMSLSWTLVLAASLSAQSTVIRGTCVDAATGKLLAGCRVVFNSHEPLVTGADGRFESRVRAGRSTAVSLRISSDGFVPHTRLWSRMEPIATDDLGKIEMRRGVYAHGKVVDHRGVGLPGVTIRFRRLSIASSTPKHAVARWLSQTVSGVGGAFRSGDALPPGEHSCSIEARGIVLAKPEKIRIPPEGRAKASTITVRAPRLVTGRVLDDVGRPVEGVVLATADAMTRSRSGGFFRVDARANSSKSLRIRVLDGGRCEKGAKTGELKWGRYDIVIRLKRLPTVDLTVVEADTGKPVEDYSIRTSSLTVHSFNRYLTQSGKHKGGRIIAEGLARGRGRLVVVPKDPTLHYAVVEVVGSDKMAPMRVRVQRLVPMKALVVDAKGKLLADRDVRVIIPGDGQCHDLRRERSMGLGAESTDLTRVFDSLVYEAKTDAAGQCILYGIKGRDDLIVSIGKGHREDQRFEGIQFGPKHLSRKFRLEK